MQMLAIYEDDFTRVNFRNEIRVRVNTTSAGKQINLRSSTGGEEAKTSSGKKKRKNSYFRPFHTIPALGDSLQCFPVQDPFDVNELVGRYVFLQAILDTSKHFSSL